ncbi:serine hydrolase [Flavitalea sp. BT771]|uniref:serine hydrolase n=1 Tax=Flavitalea sp. BT771 TaxID=3063329 RepID=UPI0026E308C8|nr:serine hydrolase [Flavitalea sp. BT771]MDO6432387.1 serine hydrolase [Flavitalea sp. BT771]MDV6221297.1 serine hydrolase [Flavitalea sp. BT771]
MKPAWWRFPLFLSFYALTAAGQRQQPLDKAALFDNYVRKALAVWRTPGMSIVVVKDDQMVFKKGFGVTELGKTAAFTTATIGVCASTTKAMTAVCMGMLVDEGKLRWTDRLRDVFPEFSLYDPYVAAELTVRDLFTHNAGLGNTDGLWAYGYSRDEILRRVRWVPPAYSLRSSFTYQNVMYIVAGELIRKVSGQTWEDFITHRLFGPLGMHHSYASYALGAGEPSKETPHFMMPDSSIRTIPFLYHEDLGPAGGVWSCADDMEKWMRFMLDSARVNGRRLLKAGTWSELFRPQSLVTESEFYPTVGLTHSSWTTYGLGWFQEDYRGRMVQFHTGSLDGAVAIVGLMPSEHFGIYIFGNLDHSELRHALMYKAMDLWGFSDNSRDWSAECYAMYKKVKDEGRQKDKEKEARRVKGTKPSVPLATYAGKYTNEIYGDAHVILGGDSLRVEFPNNVCLRLQHWNYDTFVGYYDYFWWDREWIQFSLDPEGKIMQFEKDGVVYKPVKN